MCDIMPTGSSLNFNHKKTTATLTEFFNHMEVGDMVTKEEILDYLSSIPITKMKDVITSRGTQRNRRLSRNQLVTSWNYLSTITGTIPNVLRGPLYSTSSTFIYHIVLFVKTNENRDVVCFHCGSYIEGGASEFGKSNTKNNAPLGKHIMCEECYKYEVKMFNPNSPTWDRTFQKAYDDWEGKRNWSEEE